MHSFLNLYTYYKYIQQIFYILKLLKIFLLTSESLKGSILFIDFSWIRNMFIFIPSFFLSFFYGTMQRKPKIK